MLKKITKRSFGLGLLLIILFKITPLSSVQSQENILLEGPLVISNTPAQDGFIITDLGTNTQRELSFGVGDHYIGGFSPDGCQILFTWEAELGQGHLYTANLDGSNLQQLTKLGRTGALSFRMWEPTWSPDGSRIAFTLARYYNPPDEDPYRTTHIAWIPATGGEPAFYSNSGTEGQPRWSPNSHWLIYVSIQTVVEGEVSEEEEPPTKPELWIVGINGNNKHRFTDFGSGGVYNPKWSPDSNLVAFQFEAMGNSHQIMVLPYDGSGAPTVLNSQRAMILDYDWRPTGDEILVAMRGYQGENENTLWTLPIDTTNPIPTRLVDTTALDYPRFSSDGRWVAFRQAYELAIYDLFGDGEILLMGENTRSNSAPVWSPTNFKGEAACLEQ